ncbi:hypothetical protein SeLEV6574_g04165 [Synchytrium endobioticum]|uniref:Pentacotripeptide-repeat region of PRORP domain-containing protein n=1 Tax=Synchytrium endobioticum TaxID=286115 RepID=A0A507D0N0_9FUNG|nr:hypothetical protein SeLEV6574_g04165 [Synchytrium endobioticum]
MLDANAWAGQEQRLELYCLILLYRVHVQVPASGQVVDLQHRTASESPGSVSERRLGPCRPLEVGPRSDASKRPAVPPASPTRLSATSSRCSTRPMPPSRPTKPHRDRKLLTNAFLAHWKPSVHWLADDWILYIKAHHMLLDLQQATALIRAIQSTAVPLDSHIYAEIITALGLSNHHLNAALLLFDQSVQLANLPQDSTLLNALLIQGFARIGDVTSVDKILYHMAQKGWPIDIEIYRLIDPDIAAWLIKGLATIHLPSANRIASSLRSMGLPLLNVAAAELAGVYASKALVDTTEVILGLCAPPSMEAYSKVIQAYFKRGLKDRAMLLYKEALTFFPEDAKLYVIVITGLLSNCSYDLARDLWEDMLKKGIKTPLAVYTAFIHVYGLLHAFEKGEQVTKRNKNQEYRPVVDTCTIAVLARFYSTKGDIKEALTYLTELDNRMIRIRRNGRKVDNKSVLMAYRHIIDYYSKKKLAKEVYEVLVHFCQLYPEIVPTNSIVLPILHCHYHFVDAKSALALLGILYKQYHFLPSRRCISILYKTYLHAYTAKNGTTRLTFLHDLSTTVPPLSRVAIYEGMIHSSAMSKMYLHASKLWYIMTARDGLTPSKFSTIQMAWVFRKLRKCAIGLETEVFENNHKKTLFDVKDNECIKYKQAAFLAKQDRTNDGTTDTSNGIQYGLFVRISDSGCDQRAVAS